MEKLSQRQVSPSAAALARLQALDHSLPDEPTDPAEVLTLLDEIGSPATVASAGGRYFGFVSGGSLPAALAAGYPILNEVVLNQVLGSFGEADRTRRVIAALQDEGTCWCGGTLWQGQPAMRISVSSWATTEADVEKCLHVILRVAE